MGSGATGYVLPGLETVGGAALTMFGFPEFGIPLMASGAGGGIGRALGGGTGEGIGAGLGGALGGGFEGYTGGANPVTASMMGANTQQSLGNLVGGNPGASMAAGGNALATQGGAGTGLNPASAGYLSSLGLDPSATTGMAPAGGQQALPSAGALGALGSFLSPSGVSPTAGQQLAAGTQTNPNANWAQNAATWGNMMMNMNRAGTQPQQQPQAPQVPPRAQTPQTSLNLPHPNPNPTMPMAGSVQSPTRLNPQLMAQIAALLGGGSSSSGMPNV